MKVSRHFIIQTQIDMQQGMNIWMKKKRKRKREMRDQTLE